jgi:hypothetical protein
LGRRLLGFQQCISDIPLGKIHDEKHRNPHDQGDEEYDFAF